MSVVLTIMGYGFREAVRRKVFAVVVLLTAAFLVLFWLASIHGDLIKTSTCIAFLLAEDVVKPGADLFELTGVQLVAHCVAFLIAAAISVARGP